MYYTKELDNQYRVQFDSELKILAVSKEISIVPEDFGFTPYSPITCIYYEGYCGTYSLGQSIILEELHIFSHDNYPPLNGILPSEQDFYGNQVYKNIGLKVPYTGNVLVAKNPVERYKLYRDATRHRAWAYQFLRELVYEDGVCEQIIDHSKAGELIRSRFQSEPGFAKRYYEGIKYENHKQFFQEEFNISNPWFMDFYYVEM